MVPCHGMVPHPLHKQPVNPINWELGLSVLPASAKIALIKESWEQPIALDYSLPTGKKKPSRDKTPKMSHNSITKVAIP